MARIRKETERWQVVCPCGHSQDLWSYGGLRWKASGTVKIRGRCDGCGKVQWLTVSRND